MKKVKKENQTRIDSFSTAPNTEPSRTSYTVPIKVEAKAEEAPAKKTYSWQKKSATEDVKPAEKPATTTYSWNKTSETKSTPVKPAETKVEIKVRVFEDFILALLYNFLTLFLYTIF